MPIIHTATIEPYEAQFGPTDHLVAMTIRQLPTGGDYMPMLKASLLYPFALVMLNQCTKLCITF
jgi:hypothetical protein